MCLYLRTKFKVSSVILTSFRQGIDKGVILPPTAKRIPNKPTLIRIKIYTYDTFYIVIESPHSANATIILSIINNRANIS